MRQRILEEYNVYARAVLPPDTDPVQKLETRKAFYAGVGTGAMILVQNSHVKQDMMQTANELMEELAAFVQKCTPTSQE